MTYILAFIAGGLLSIALTHLHIRICYKMGWLVYPSPRRIHKVPTPHVGGLALYLAFTLVIASFALVGQVSSYHAIAIVGFSTALTLLGFADDLYDLSASIRLLFQVACAIAVAAGFGIMIQSVTLPILGTIYLDRTISGYMFTIFWIVGMIQTANLSDGIDGLTAGLSTIFSVFLLLVAIRLGQYELGIYASTLAGVSLGFLRYNFAPAKIFMGDSGAYFLGFLMAVLSILGSAKLTTALLVMGVPIADVAYSIIRRIRAGVVIHMADKEHLHQKLVTLGLSQRVTAIIFYIIAILFGAAGLIRTREIRILALASLFVLAAIIILYVDRRSRFIQSKHIESKEN